MDPALVLLLRLRFWGWLRRAGRKLATARGLVLTLVGLTMFLPWMFSIFFAPMPAKMADSQIEGFRRLGPIFFVIYCLVTLLFSPGDKAFAFTPAEISFLFPAPFSRRALLAYKIGGQIGLIFLSAIFMTAAFRGYSRIWVAGYLGVVLSFAFVQLFAMAVTLAGQAIGAAASSWRRRLALVLIVAGLGATAISLGWRTFREAPTLETLRNLENAPAVRAVLAPFRPFVRAVSADRLWPDFLLWGGAALAIDAALVALILLLDAQYLEAAAVNSERMYARLERMRKGGPALSDRKKNRTWKELPPLPWWGGLGPILWRQLTAASRDYARAITPYVILVGLAGFGIFLSTLGPNPTGKDPFSLGFGGAILVTSILFSPLLNFDFRSDIDRMEGLKTLPISPARLSMGQLATPTVLLTSAQLLALIVLAIGTWPVAPEYWAYAAFALPLNVLLLEVENLMFLWFPSRPMAHTPGDIQAMGRMMLMMIAKALVLGATLGLAAGFGFLGWWIGGLIAMVVSAWLVMAGMVAAFVPMIGAAFTRFDVASDMPA